MPPTRALLERARELATLDDLIENASDGRAAVCAIEGPAGIGKTRLLAEAKARAGELGIRVLSATASELEQGFGFGVVGQLFEPAVLGEGAQLLSGAAAAARPIVAPDSTRAPDGPARDAAFATLHGLYWLTVRISEQQPVLLAVDDLQWCDVPSLRFLSYLRARLEGLPVVLVATVRQTDPGYDDAGLDAVLAGSMAVRVRPRPLTHAATSALIEQWFGARPEGDFASACHGATGGNPLLLDELMKVLDAEGARPDTAHLPMLDDLGPGAVPRTLFLRMRRLGADAIATARALAVLGDGTDLTAMAELAGLELARAGEATAALARVEILRAEPPLGFVHPLVADAVYHDVLAGERGLLHLRAAELLDAARAPVEQVAGHLLHGPSRGTDWVVDRLVQAAVEATRKGAADSAVTYLRRALIEPPAPDRHAEVLSALGLAELLVDGPAAAGHLRAAYTQFVDPAERAGVAFPLARALHFTGASDEAVQVLRETAAELPPALQGTREQLEAFELFCALFGAGSAEAHARLEPYRTRPAGESLGARMLAAIAAQAWMYDCGPSAAVAELSLGALSGGRLVEADPGWAANFPITNLTYADHEEAEGWWELVTAEAHRRGSMLTVTAISLWRGNALRRRGDLSDAERTVRDCQESVREWGFTDWGHLYADAHLAAVLRDRGDLVAARAAMGDGPDPSRDDEPARQWYASELELLVAEGAFDAALTASAAYAERFDARVRNPVDAPWRSLRALALDQLGRRDEALELVSEELELARAWGAHGTVGRTLRTLGTIERRSGIEHLEEAVDVLARSHARLEYAKALTALGAALRRWRQPSTARVHLREALELAAISGAELLVEEARRELYAAGGRPRRTALTGAASLTTSERRVASLAAEGLTNREIGETLFVTPKTVAMHLSNIYRKLGVTSRRQLPSGLAETMRPDHASPQV